MFYKRCFYVWVSFILFCVSAVLFVSVLIDPISLWYTTVIPGINNYKLKEGSYLAVSKPYQYKMLKPDIVYFGSSRVYVGLPPVYPGIDDEKVYNFGGSSLNVKDIKEYLRFIYKIHKPKKVYIGLDFFMFGKSSSQAKRTGFSLERLDAIASTQYVFYKLNENAQYFKIIKDTYKDSRKNKQADILFLRGWDVKRGTGKFNKNAYDHDIKSYTKTYKNWQLDENVFEDLKVIKREATAAEVDIQIYFSPTSKSLQELIKKYGHENDFAKIKLDVASIFGITKDFCFENEYTGNLNEYFYDASHSTKKLGLLVIDELAYDRRNEKFVRIIEARP